MRTDINHLPPNKQQELDRVVEMLFQGFLEATQDAKGRRKSARILKIILFGSYARGDWVDAPLDANRYKSDYDILVIVNQKELADRADYWEETEQRLVVAYTVEKAIETLMNFIVHSLQEVNDQLAHGRIFFGEIVKDGALLYESDDRPLATLKPKSPLQAYETAKDYFEDHFGDAMRNFEIAQFARQKEFLKMPLLPCIKLRNSYTRACCLRLPSTPPQPQYRFPARLCRTARASAFRCLAARDTDRARDIPEAQGSLSQGPLLKAL
jgi:predicted nucleotidyltransferase